MLDTNPCYVFEYAELEKILKDLYGIEISVLESLIPDELIGHYTYHKWDVDGESELDLIGDEEIVAEWIETGDMDKVCLEHIMHRLFIEGHIPAGKYVMLVDW